MDKIITFVLIFFNICLPCYANDNANKYTTTFNNSKAYWHSLIEQFMKENQAYFYLRGLENSEFRGIKNNLVEAGMLLQILDDDLDNDACDYRSNHSGGDLISNDPLILDLRTERLRD
ncbi:hypothetical protein IT084_17505 [Desulfallas sp. Bu1-1]|uniref:hypothetical protein n=1 Tax=Desulfallas sp. Bu1-1 TaxID=2787620 RepID=UPI00189F7919|nr:hypothetical protein [Desulfallas sp. Bu1-1]MBF7084736.1 hypothetical protein [Desulfallas sp. Bu1-1]